eukprot:7467835-Alexandrium_andersonii.AAC.1
MTGWTSAAVKRTTWSAGVSASTMTGGGPTGSTGGPAPATRSPSPIRRPVGEVLAAHVACAASRPSSRLRSA